MYEGRMQLWILGEASEAVASGPPFENTAFSFILLYMFFRDYYEVGTKSGKYELDSK